MSGDKTAGLGDLVLKAPVADLREEQFVRAMGRLKTLLDRMEHASPLFPPDALRAEAVKELCTLLRVGANSGLTDERTVALIEECLIEAAREEN